MPRPRPAAPTPARAGRPAAVSRRCGPAARAAACGAPIAGDNGRVSKRSPASGRQRNQGHQNDVATTIHHVRDRHGSLAAARFGPRRRRHVTAWLGGRSIARCGTGKPARRWPTAWSRLFRHPHRSSARAKVARQRPTVHLQAASGRGIDIAASYRACGKEA